MAAANIGLKARDLDKAKPKEIKAAKLADALKMCEKALADEKRKKDDADAIGAGLEAVEAVQAALETTIKKECDAKKHKDLIAGLKKLDATCAAEVKRLQTALEKAGGDDEEGEVSDEELLGQKLFKACLKKAKTKGSALDGVSFCVGVTKKAEDCRLVMVKKKNFAKQTFRRFLKICKDNKNWGLEKKRLTYGAAYRDPNESTTLVLQIAEGANTAIPGMTRKLGKWMLKNKQEMAPFKNLVILDPAGKPMVSPPDPEDQDQEEAKQGAADEDQAADENAQPDVKTPEASEQAPAPEAAQASGEDQKSPEAEAPAEPAPAVGPGPQNDDEVEDLRKELKKCRRDWQQTKEQCIRSIEAVKDGIRDYYLDDPEQFKLATSKLTQLDAIMDNLGDDLRDCLDKYVATPRNRRSDLEAHRTRAVELVANFLRYASRDPLLQAIDEESELADPNLKVKEPIERSLKNLLKTLR